MKNRLVWFLTACLSGVGFGHRGIAQPVDTSSVCVPESEFKRQQNAWMRAYRSAADLFDPGYKQRAPGQRPEFEMEPDERRLHQATQQVRQDVQALLKQENLMTREGFYLGLMLFTAADGRIERAVLTRSAYTDTASRVIPPAMQEALCRWLSRYRFPLAGNRPFWFHTSVPTGPILQVRNLRRGRGIAATLEAVRKTSRPDTIRTLLLNGLALEQVPSEILNLPNLKDLDLSNNALTQIPEAVFRLPRLRLLNLSGNKIGEEGLPAVRNRHLRVLNLQNTGLTRIPEAVAANRRLESLWLGYNDLSGGINVEPLQQLRRLKDLNFYHANLRTLPAGIGRLRRLEVLDLYYNKLRELPDELGRLRRLQQLAVSNNQLGQLPERLSRMRRLQVLYAHHNYLASLPKDLPRLRRLHLLDVNHNAYGYVPETVSRLRRLRELDLSHNRLTELPANLTALPRLRKVFVRGNPMTDPTRLAVIRQLEERGAEVFY